MKILVVQAHPDPASFNSALRDVVIGVLSKKHSVELLDLYRDDFQPAMPAEERNSYELHAPPTDPYIIRSAAALHATDALVFVYPTWWFGMPAVMKGWIERVMIPGVGFSREQGTKLITPGLTNIKRVCGVTTYGSARLNIFAATDGGRRTVNRSVRPLCGVRCRRTWLSMSALDTATAEDRAAFIAKIERTLARW